MQDTLTLDNAVYAFCTIKIEFINLEVIKKDSVYYIIQGEFFKSWKGQRKAKAHTIAQTPNRGYVVQGYLLCLTINCFYYKKDNHR